MLHKTPEKTFLPGEFMTNKIHINLVFHNSEDGSEIEFMTILFVLRKLFD